MPQYVHAAAGQEQVGKTASCRPKQKKAVLEYCNKLQCASCTVKLAYSRLSEVHDEDI